MFNTEQTQQLTELMLESEIDTTNQNEVTEYLCLLLEDVAGCECLSDSDFEDIQLKVQSTLDNVSNGNLAHHTLAVLK